ncbi:MAG: hypothetical protein R3B99_28235 [Polyangiales bacterium]
MSRKYTPVLGFLVCLVAVVAGPRGVEADSFEPPPPPSEHAPRVAGEVHLDIVFPFADRPLCPSGGACVFGGGGGIGGIVEWRWPSGWALGAGYDVWLLDGNGVHELSTLQVLRLVGRRYFLRARQIHPFVGGAIGGLLFGDAFRRNAGGGSVDLFSGFELEILPTLAFVVDVGVRLFATSAFTSRSDGLDRASSFGLDGAAMLQVGLALTP